MALTPHFSRKTRIILIGVLITALIVVGITLGVVIPLLYKKSPNEAANFVSSSILGNFTKAIVVTDAAPCAKVGKDILEKGGSAVDCAIATLLCMGVVLPHSMGLGGGFFMVIYNKQNDTVEVLDSRETAPLKATENMFDGDSEASSVGGKAVAVPGEVHGYVEAYSKHGTLPWADLFTGAIELSRNGFLVGDHLAAAIAGLKDKISKYPGLRDLLTNPVTKSLFKANELMKNPPLVKTLERLAANWSVWDTEIAAELDQEIQDHGGVVTLQDMLDYKPVWKNPSKIELGSKYNLYTVPLPGGGPVLSFILNILQNYNFSSNSLSDTETSVLTNHRIIEAFKFAYAKRMELGDVGDEAMSELVRNLTSPEYANAVKNKIFDNQTFEDPEYYGVKMYTDTDQGTAHLAILAPNGDAVSVTSTINAYFGSKLRSTLTGIILNNEMDDFSSPNITNGFNVPPSVPNYIVPGKRPLSSMVPTIITDKEGNVKMVVGAAGGTHITTGVAVVILRTLFMGENVKQAIDAPRLHHQLFPNHVTYEKNFPQDILQGLNKLGHVTDELKSRGAVIQSLVRGDDDRLYGNSDYRKGGSTDGF